MFYNKYKKYKNKYLNLKNIIKEDSSLIEFNKQELPQELPQEYTKLLISDTNNFYNDIKGGSYKTNIRYIKKMYNEESDKNKKVITNTRFIKTSDKYKEYDKNKKVKSNICFITAIYGNYEVTCKKFTKQTVSTDFICFTDNQNILSNGWIIDTFPYHYENKNELDDDSYVNSLSNNKHTFNIAKYYKQSFQRILRLKEYDVIVWLDGTIEITYNKTSEYIIKNIYNKKIIGWHHEYRKGILKNEVIASHYSKYTSTNWNGQNQPYQDIDKQYNDYIKDGYNDLYYKKLNSHTPHMGVWITCFIAFLNKDNYVKQFLDLWYLQTLKYTTQDQISFSYVCQKLNMIPFTLPNNKIYGKPHVKTLFYIKHLHNK